MIALHRKRLAAFRKRLTTQRTILDEKKISLPIKLNINWIVDTETKADIGKDQASQSRIASDQQKSAMTFECRNR